MECVIIRKIYLFQRKEENDMNKPAYVDVAEVCRDWGCSRSKGYAIIKQLSEQMKAENPRLLTMSGKINRIYYEEACMRR